VGYGRRAGAAKVAPAPTPALQGPEARGSIRGREEAAFARELVRMMKAEKVLVLKVEGGCEITLHPQAFISDVQPDVGKLAKKDLPKMDDKNILRLRERIMQSEEQINGEALDEDTLFASSEGETDPHGR
jgi:hypothetical protein